MSVYVGIDVPQAVPGGGDRSVWGGPGKPECGEWAGTDPGHDRRLAAGHAHGVRGRARLVELLEGCGLDWIHVVVGGHGHDRPTGCWSGPAGAWLDSLPLPSVSREVINDDLVLIDALQIPIDRLDWEVHQRARSGPRVNVLAQLRGMGPVIGLVILAEIGDASRFGSARKRAAWAGLTRTARGFGPHHPARPHLSITATLQA